MPEIEEDGVELRLLTEPAYAEELDLQVEEIIEQYIAGEFAGEELDRVRNYFFKSEVRKEQLRFALALKQRKFQTAAAVTEKPATVVHLQPKRRSLTPYLAIAASLIVVVGVGYWALRGSSSQSDLDKGLVALNTAYSRERPIEARLSDLNYAPLPNQRGGTPRIDYVQKELANSLLLKAATEKPSVQSYRALGQSYLADRQFDKAIDQFNAALGLDPNDAKSHLNLGAALLEKGKLNAAKPQAIPGVEDFSRSLDHLNKGLQLDNTSLEGYFNRALVYQHMMLPRDAEAAWKEYLQKDPGSAWAEEAKRNLASLLDVFNTNGSKTYTQLKNSIAQKGYSWTVGASA